MYGKSFSYYVMHDGEDGFIKLTASRFNKDGWEHLTELLDFPYVLGANQESIDEMTNVVISAFVQQKAAPFYANMLGPNDGEFATPS